MLRLRRRFLTRRLRSWTPRSFAVLLIRRQAEAGLLWDGGMTATETCGYVRELRREAEQEVLLRSGKQAHCN